jgi:hypothetical protein
MGTPTVYTSTIKNGPITGIGYDRQQSWRLEVTNINSYLLAIS